MNNSFSYEDQLKNPIGNLFWNKRRILSTEWFPNEDSGIIRISIPYRMTVVIKNKKEIEKRIFSAVIVKARGEDYEKNNDMLQKCLMSCSLVHPSDFCILEIYTYDHNIYTHFRNKMNQRIKPF